MTGRLAVWWWVIQERADRALMSRATLASGRVAKRHKQRTTRQRFRLRAASGSKRATLAGARAGRSVARSPRHFLGMLPCLSQARAFDPRRHSIWRCSAMHRVSLGQPSACVCIRADSCLQAGVNRGRRVLCYEIDAHRYLRYVWIYESRSLLPSSVGHG